MKANSIIDIAAAIVTIALVTVIVGSPNTSTIIGAIGNTFSGSIRAASGR